MVLITCMVSTAKGQMKIITNVKGDSVRILWKHNWKDIEGGIERIERFRLFVIKNDSLVEWVGDVVDTKSVGMPDTTYVFRNLIPNTKYVFGVIAVDYAGNVSTMHKSTDPNAALGGWYVIIDTVSPSGCSGMSIF